MSKRNIPINILLTIITCGLYGLYWQAKVNDEVHELSGNPQTTTGGKSALYSLITCSLYYMFWVYKIGDELAQYRVKKGWDMDSVSASVYTWVAVITTFLATAFGGLEFAVNFLASLTDEGSTAQQISTEETIIAFLVFSFGYLVIIFIVHSVFTGIILWVNYKRNDKNPSALYLVMAILRTNVLTTAFLQASLNDVIERLEAEKGV